MMLLRLERNIMEEQFSESLDNMTGRLEGWFDTIVTNLPNAILAILVFALAIFLSRKISKWINRPLARFISQSSIRDLVSTLVSALIVLVGIFLALGILNLDTVLKTVLAGAGIGGLAIGLALQGTLSNSFSGIYLSVKRVINIGDWIETNGYQGKVEHIDLRATKVKEPDNNIVVIPNRMIVDNPFKNFGLTDRVRVTINCGVGYESDLREVKSIAVQAIKDEFPQDPNEDIEFHYLEFGGSSINFQMRFWVAATAKLTLLEAKSEAIMILKQALDEHSINIPFPIRTLQMETPLQLQRKEDIEDKGTSQDV